MTTRENLSIEMARRIYDAFGPNSTLFECGSPDEIKKFYDSEEYGSILEYAQAHFEVEKDQVEGMNDAAAHREEGTGEKGHHQKVIDEGKELLEGIQNRLRAMGLEVK